ncbi:MAG: leucine-rich repeat domain-containing protein [Clostridiales bacterium]|nr:leucine-rich repeat domain-containing protein [Clostridiales bacterium]
MNTITKRKSGFLFAFIAVAALLAAVAILGFGGSGTEAHAETYGSEGDYTFTLVIDAEGNSSYKAAIKTTLRNTATVAIVPDTYNGLPVTELANNAFMSCKNLTKVVLPKSVTKIGTNAFINCSQLNAVHMPGVEEIGATAFSMCSALDRLYIPKTVKKVGANILRNNANTVLVQSAAEDLGDGWSSTWNNYHTGDVVYSATPEDSIAYREIYNEAGTEVIGYEVCEGQTISTADEDVVIYNAYRPDESSEYLPVYNICQDAFFAVTLKSLTIKDRPEDDEDFPVFDHKINIRSNAFVMACIDDIIIEADVTFDHPADLQVGPAQNSLGYDVVGDADGHSVGVFEEALMYSVTLPSTLDAVYDRMFYDCTSLMSIKIAGQEYDGINKLPDVTTIGDGAFSSCGCLQNLEIPSTVTNMGSQVFYDWGTSVDPQTHQKITQYINIQLFEKKLPAGWSEKWADGIYSDNVVITYKEIIVTIDLADGKGGFITVSVVPDELMPDIDIPVYYGYLFMGAFTEYDGKGLQYYNERGEGVRVWCEGDPTLLRAHKHEKSYDVILEREGTETYYVHPQFKHTMPAASMPTKRGYAFGGYYYLESDGTKTFYYNADMSSARDWDRDENCTLLPEWILIEYTITYHNLKGGQNPAENPTKYTVESDTIVFADPYGRLGYNGKWLPDSIPHGSIGDKDIYAEWSAIEYDIEFIDKKNGKNPNPTKYTIESPTIIFAKPYGVDGYDGKWIPASIPSGSTGKVTVTADWTPLDYYIKYDNLLDGVNPTSNPTKYTIEDLTIVFEKPFGRVGYTGDWDITRIPHGSTNDVTVTAVWTPIKYNIWYENMNGAYNRNPSKITIEDEIELRYVTRTGYSLLGWKLKGKYVAGLSGIHEDITLTAVWSDGKTANLTADMVNVFIHVDGSTVVLPSTNFTSAYGCTINIVSYMRNVTITSNTNIMYRMNIAISETCGIDLSLYLNRVSMQSAKPSTPAISMHGFVLYLHTTGTCVIYGHDGQRRYSPDDEYDGSCAIDCSKLAIAKADDLTIRGGNGSSAAASGLYGGAGFKAVSASAWITVSTPNVKLIGGNGGNGKAGHGSQGYGAEATDVKPTGSYAPTMTKGSNGIGAY